MNSNIILMVTFWSMIFLAVYTYALFPLILILFGRKKMPPPKAGKPGDTGVALLCSVYNEEKVIKNKIDNFYKLHYPSAVFYIGLDGCTDNTLAEIERATRDDRVKYFSFSRQGKAGTINSLVEKVQAEFIVMTDANSMLEPEAINNLLRGMSDKVGVVCGRLRLLDSNGNSGEGFYWKQETLIKAGESAYGSVIGANGAIYMLRRSLFEKLPPGTINDDFSISMKIYEKGYDVVYAHDAVAIEEITTSDREEFRRHIRDSAGHYRAVLYLWRLLNPFKFKRFFFYVSHRVMRWLVPITIPIIFIITVALHNILFYKFLLYSQISLFVLLFVVHFFKIRFKLFYIPYYFLLINSALLLGFFKYVFGAQRVIWEPTKR
jgi:cellulose synthase/poly-beta-1,6-N-acetylglucosamine synthase-like glycosyltransferase